MVTLTVEIEQEKDLRLLQILLDRLELEYHLEGDDVLSDAEIESIEAGLKDIAEGRVHTHEEAKARIAETIAKFRDADRGKR